MAQNPLDYITVKQHCLGTARACTFESFNFGAGYSLEVRVLTARTEDASLVPSTQIRQLTPSN